MGKLLREKWLWVVLVVILGCFGVGVVSRLRSNNPEPSSGDTQSSGGIEERLGLNGVSDITNASESTADSFDLLITTASILEVNGEVAEAEEYYKSALDQAKTTSDQEMIDGAYRLLLTYYRNNDKGSQYDALAGELSQEKLDKLFEVTE